MPVPCWDDPIATARDQADTRLARGLPVRPTLIGFEGREPTLYVRGRMPVEASDLDLALPEVLLLPRMLGIRRLMLISQVTMSDADPADADPRPSDLASARPGEANGVGASANGGTVDGATDANRDLDAKIRRALFAERAIVVERVHRVDGGRLDSIGDVLPYRIDDHGRCCWEDPITLPDGGPWTGVVDQQLTAGDPDDAADDADDALGPTGAAYALTRFGVTVAVAPSWRTRYGFDGRIDHRGVRREDRRRAREHDARRAGITAAEVRP